MGEEKIPKLGSLYVSVTVHDFLSSIVSASEPSDDSPFTSIVEAFRFAFSLGYSRDIKIKAKGSTKTVSPRQFIVNEYTDILESDLTKEFSSLGGLVSAYAEAGSKLMMNCIDSGNSIMFLLDNNELND